VIKKSSCVLTILLWWNCWSCLE